MPAILSPPSFQTLPPASGMAWYVWFFLILLLTSWLVLLYKSLVWLGCCHLCRCRTTTTHKGVTRDSDGNVLACRFCAIAAQQRQQGDLHTTQHHSTSPTSPPPPHFDTIHDPTAVLPPVPQLTSSPPSLTPILYSTPWLVVFSPLHPCAARHLLVIPRQHIDDCHSLVAMAASTAQQQRRGREQSNDSELDDDSCDGADDDDEQTTDADYDEVSSSLQRRRRWSAEEEEKQLTPHQYITHMMEVGELLLNNPQLLSDPNGGTRLTQHSHQHNSRLRRLMRRMDCRRGGRRLCKGRRRTSRNGRVERTSERMEAGEEDEENDREEQMEVERSEKQQLLLDTTKPAKQLNSQHNQLHGNGVNGRSREDREDGQLLSLSLLSPAGGARRRTPHSPFPPSTPSTATATTRSNPATPTAVSRTLSSSTSSLLSSSSSSSSPSHIVGVVDGSTVFSGGGRRRYCFHVPPHNSISHLHLHCIELPFDGWRSEWSFLANMKWCKEADTVKWEIERANKAAVATITR